MTVFILNVHKVEMDSVWMIQKEAKITLWCKRTLTYFISIERIKIKADKRVINLICHGRKIFIENILNDGKNWLMKEKMPKISVSNENYL